MCLIQQTARVTYIGGHIGTVDLSCPRLRALSVLQHLLVETHPGMAPVVIIEDACRGY